LDNNISKISNVSVPAPSKGQRVRRKANPIQAADFGVKLEIDSFQGSGEDYRVQKFKKKGKQTEASAGGITSADVHAFVGAYNRMLGSIDEDAYHLRVEVYKPVELYEPGRKISLYEIGVAHSPNNRSSGMLTIDDAMLNAALNYRGADITALFIKEGDGLLHRMLAIAGGIAWAEEFLAVCAGIICTVTESYTRGMT
jgi:hypothetical protein